MKKIVLLCLFVGFSATPAYGMIKFFKKLFTFTTSQHEEDTPVKIFIGKSQRRYGNKKLDLSKDCDLLFENFEEFDFENIEDQNIELRLYRLDITAENLNKVFLSVGDKITSLTIVNHGYKTTFPIKYQDLKWNLLKKIEYLRVIDCRMRKISKKDLDDILNQFAKNRDLSNVTGYISKSSLFKSDAARFLIEEYNFHNAKQDDEKYINERADFYIEAYIKSAEKPAMPEVRDLQLDREITDKEEEENRKLSIEEIEDMAKAFFRNVVDSRSFNFYGQPDNLELSFTDKEEMIPEWKEEEIDQQEEKPVKIIIKSSDEFKDFDFLTLELEGQNLHLRLSDLDIDTETLNDSVLQVVGDQITSLTLKRLKNVRYQDVKWELLTKIEYLNITNADAGSNRKISLDDITYILDSQFAKNRSILKIDGSLQDSFSLVAPEAQDYLRKYFGVNNLRQKKEDRINKLCEEYETWDKNELMLNEFKEYKEEQASTGDSEPTFEEFLRAKVAPLWDFKISKPDVLEFFFEDKEEMIPERNQEQIAEQEETEKEFFEL